MKRLVFLGLFGLIDPPRPEAIEAVGTCQRAGIRVKMITGDHRVTAMAIAAQVGLINADRALTGQDIEAMDDERTRRQDRRCRCVCAGHPRAQAASGHRACRHRVAWYP